MCQLRFIGLLLTPPFFPHRAPLIVHLLMLRVADSRVKGISGSHRSTDGSCLLRSFEIFLFFRLF